MGFQGQSSPSETALKVGFFLSFVLHEYSKTWANSPLMLHKSLQLLIGYALNIFFTAKILLIFITIIAHASSHQSGCIVLLTSKSRYYNGRRADEVPGGKEKKQERE